MNRRLLAWVVLVAGVTLAIWGKQQHDAGQGAEAKGLSATERTVLAERGEQAGILGGILTFAGLVMLFVTSSRGRR